MCWEDDDYDEGPCYMRPRALGAILIFFMLTTVVTLTLSIIDIHKIRKSESEYHKQQNFVHSMEVKVRPQFYSISKFNETHIPSSIIMVKDESLYSKAYCVFDDSSITRLDFMLQLDLDFTATDIQQYINTQVEFRFETPYGMELQSTNQELNTKCPNPECGRWDYRDHIGNGNFLNADSVFITQTQVYINTLQILPVPITCGCSMEVPPRFSCLLPSSILYGEKGSIAIFISMIYQSE